ncbi:dynamin family protein [Siminovitchia sediminis]|uniref:Dynamin family protein n=1 Tax=Siminovitchia sediminis TaxID=1274353 RepID=A0ABW4KK42_9BACI
MSVLEKIQNLQKTFSMSPLCSLDKSLPIHPDIIQQLQSFRNETDILMEKCYHPLKIVLMGEVKAGKSTLLNVFAGEAVSPTNVTETTASIIEVKHSNQKKGSIIRKVNETIDGSTDEIYEILSANKGNQDFFSDVSEVKLGFPLANLQKLYLVDTPGIATVTASNEKTAKGYIQNSDVVLWVFNGHHLGQQDIEEELTNVKSYGKPIIAVINRLDEIDGSAEELEGYIEDQLGFMIDEVFAISAYQAFEGTLHGDQELLEESRFPALLSYLDTIEKEDKQVHLQSISSSINALVEKERLNHQIANDTITFLLQTMERRKEEIKYHNDSIQKKIKMELQSWVSTHLLEDEKRNLLRELEGLGMMSGKASYESISSQMNHYLSSEYILEMLERKFSEINTSFQQQWNQAVETIGEKINIEEEEFRKGQIQLYQDTDVPLEVYFPQGENAVADGAIKGAAIGGAYGVAAATYAAVLGPSAAGVTLGAAMGAVMPPVLLIGAVTGIAAKLVFGNKKKNEYRVEIIRAVDETKQKVSNVFLPAMLDQLENESNRIANNLYDQLCEFISQGWTAEELRDVQQKINAYNTSLVRFERVGVSF